MPAEDWAETFVHYLLAPLIDLPGGVWLAWSVA